MSVINKVQARNAAGQPVGEAYDIGGSGSGGVFALQAYGTLDMAYKQMTIDRIEGKWRELVEAIENGNEITLYANDTETDCIYPFRPQFFGRNSNGIISEVQFSTAAIPGFTHRSVNSLVIGAIFLEEGDNDGIVSGSGDYGLDTLEAKNIPITDTGSYFTGNTVEAALQELGAASGGSSGIFTVNVRRDEETLTGYAMDKTADEIKAAYTSGIPVYVRTPLNSLYDGLSFNGFITGYEPPNGTGAFELRATMCSSRGYDNNFTILFVTVVIGKTIVDEESGELIDFVAIYTKTDDEE